MNYKIFEQKAVDVRSTMIKIVAYYSEVGPRKKIHNKRKVSIRDIWRIFPINFFDDAFTQRKCKCGSYIVIEMGGYYHF